MDMAGPNARTKLLDAALSIMLAKGYSATFVDELCEAAGVSKEGIALRVIVARGHILKKQLGVTDGNIVTVSAAHV